MLHNDGKRARADTSTTQHRANGATMKSTSMKINDGKFEFMMEVINYCKSENCWEEKKNRTKERKTKRNKTKQNKNTNKDNND